MWNHRHSLWDNWFQFQSMSLMASVIHLLVSSPGSYDVLVDLKSSTDESIAFRSKIILRRSSGRNPLKRK